MLKPLTILISYLLLFSNINSREEQSNFSEASATSHVYNYEQSTNQIESLFSPKSKQKSP